MSLAATVEWRPAIAAAGARPVTIDHGWDGRDAATTIAAGTLQAGATNTLPLTTAER